MVLAYPLAIYTLWFCNIDGGLEIEIEVLRMGGVMAL